MYDSISMYRLFKLESGEWKCHMTIQKHNLHGESAGSVWENYEVGVHTNCPVQML